MKYSPAVLFHYQSLFDLILKKISEDDAKINFSLLNPATLKFNACATLLPLVHQRSHVAPAVIWRLRCLPVTRVFVIFLLPLPPPPPLPVNIQRRTCGNSSHMMRSIIVFEESHLPLSRSRKKERGSEESAVWLHQAPVWSFKVLAPQQWCLIKCSVFFFFFCDWELYLEQWRGRQPLGGEAVAGATQREMEATAAKVCSRQLDPPVGVTPPSGRLCSCQIQQQAVLCPGDF